MKKKILCLLLVLSICRIYSQEDTKQYLRELLPYEYWNPSIYIDVLKSKNRDTALFYMPFYREKPVFFASELDDTVHWYQSEDWPGYDIAYIGDGLGLPGAHSYDVIDVWDLKDQRLFKVSVTVTDSILEQNNTVDDSISFPWDLINTRSRFTFLFVFDGDFLDIFVDDFNTHFATFCRYDDATKKEIKNLINYNSYDESNVTWPRRESKNHVVNSSCTVIETLRLRKEEDTTSETMLKMERGTFVRITALGKQQTVDGITANWVKVELEDGSEGWCFGGYLVEIPEERNDSVSERAEKAQKEAIIESDDKSGNENKNESTNPEIIIAAGCLLLLLVLLIGVTVMARRKKD